MKLEYLPDLSAGGKFKHVFPNRLIRLYDFNCQEVKWVYRLIDKLVHGKIAKAELHGCDFIEPVNCQLTLVVDSKDLGLEPLRLNEFVGLFSLESYKTMMNLIEPFTKEDSNGFQWLDEYAPIDFLFSLDGSW